jgi:type VII secretion integral membrane protein EccD
MAVINADTGLAKVVVVAPKRRLDVALPEQLPVASLLPTLLRQGGDELVSMADAGGWVLRRADGSVLDAARTLAAQEVRDGELLHLVPRRTEWPQVQYDDVVDAIAAGARRGGPAWTPAATRAAGLGGAVLALLAVLVVVLLAGGPWLLPGAVLLTLSVVLVAGGAALSRALADSLAGGVVGATAMPYALVGGLLVLGGSQPLTGLGAPHVLTGCAGLLVVAMLGHVGVGDLRRFFVAGMVVAVAGVLSAVLALTLTTAAGAAAVVATTFLVLSPALPLLSVRMAKVPMPAVPRDAEDLRAGDVLPPLRQVMDQVGWSLELLTGGLIGVAVVSVTGCSVMAVSGSPSGSALAAVVSLAQLLRSRMLVAVRQRTPLLLAGAAGLVVTATGVAVGVPGWARYGLVLPVLAVCAVAAVVAALVFSRRAPSPYLGRLADLLDVTLTLAAAPVAASVLGLYGLMRGLNG